MNLPAPGPDGELRFPDGSCIWPAIGRVGMWLAREKTGRILGGRRGFQYFTSPEEAIKALQKLGQGPLVVQEQESARCQGS